MKRFSPKPTLSNIATAVRETVDSVNKNFAHTGTLIALAFVSIALISMRPNLAFAGKDDKKDISELLNVNKRETPAEMSARFKNLRDEKAKYCAGGAEADDDVCEAIKRELGNGTELKEKRCDDKASKIEDEIKKAKESCQKGGYAGNLPMCYGQIGQCDRANQTILSDYDESSTDEYCNAALANKCSGSSIFDSSGNFREDKRDAERDRKEAKTDLSDLMDRKQKKMAEQAASKRKMLEAQQNEALNARKAERAIADKVKADLKGISDDSKKAYASAKDAYMGMEVEVAKMRKESRDSSLKVSQMEAEQQQGCRASAEKKYEESEKMRLAALALRKKNIGASTNVSGSSKRRQSSLTKARTVDYNNYFTQCISGASADGKGLSNRIELQKKEAESNDKWLADKYVLLDKKRAEMLESLKSMETEAKNAGDKAVKDGEQHLKEMNEERTLIAAQNASRAAEQTNNDMQEMNLLESKITEATTAHAKTATLAQNAEDRMACAGRNGRRSESARDKVGEGYREARGSVEEVLSTCNAAKAANCDKVYASESCATVISAVSGKDSKGQESDAHKATKHDLDAESTKSKGTKKRATGK